QVAVGEDGTGMVAWERSNESVEAARWTVSAGFAPAFRFGVFEDFAFAPDVAIDAQGTAVFAYFGIRGGDRGVRIQTRTAGGTFSPSAQLASVPGTAGTHPDLTADHAGNVVLTWDEHPFAAGNPVVLHSAVRPTGQAFQNVATLSG